MLLLLPKFRLSCPTVKQGICVVPLLLMLADIEQLTDISLEETSPDFPTARLTQPREFPEVFLQCIQRIRIRIRGNFYKVFSLNKITEVVALVFHLTHSYW